MGLDLQRIGGVVIFFVIDVPTRQGGFAYAETNFKANCRMLINYI